VLNDCSVEAHTLGAFEYSFPGDERAKLLEVEVEGIRSIDPPDLVDVPEPSGRDQRSTGTLAFDERIDDDGASVHHRLDVLDRGLGICDAGHDALDEVMRGAQGFSDDELLVLAVESDNVCERSADVDGDSGAHSFVFLPSV
jgi:hypothetical protein